MKQKHLECLTRVLSVQKPPCCFIYCMIFMLSWKKTN